MVDFSFLSLRVLIDFKAFTAHSGSEMQALYREMHAWQSSRVQDFSEVNMYKPPVLPLSCKA